MRNLSRLALLAATVVLAAVSHPALAGTASLAWDPVPDTDLAGYRVYYGTSPGSYTQSVDVGNVTQTTISSLTDCTMYYFGVKAYDTAGNQSTTYSNEISGWSRPVVAASSPSAAEQGRSLALTITGSNFQAGATVAFSNAGVTVNSVTVNACGQLTANVTVGAAAAPGASSIDVTNPDGVYNTGVGIFTIQAAVAPTVQSTTPANGATGVSAAVKPTVTFSEGMLVSSITATNVKLLDGSGTPVGQAAGSPSLSSDGLTATVTPAANLSQGQTYKIQVAGGGTGVLDLGNHGMASTYTQATGFSTVADTTAPTISAVGSSGVGSTTATVTWTTSESADSQVFYRRQGDPAYQQTALDATLATSHSEPLAGLAPSTTYEFYVSSADAAGNAATSAPTQTFITGANAFMYVRFESEAGSLVAPVRAVNGATGAYGGSYLDTPSGTTTGTATAPAGTATFGVNIPSAGTWYLWVRMYGPTANSDSWYESVNGAARQQITAPAPAPGAWTWVAGRSYSLGAGLASLELGGREATARVDRVLLTNDPTFVPTEQAVGDQTPPAADTNFTGTSTTGQVTLGWKNSNSADFSQTVIRYRTDGQFPVSPVDGLPVVTKSGAAGSNDSYVQTGLANGTTYSYSAFAIDASGNVSAKVMVQTTVSDVTAPAKVTNVRRADKRTP
jgi:hypothetical protein